MAEEPRTPVAVRITRPYATEQDFLARELETLTRTSVSLLGAPQKPQGVVLRFELALASGEPLLRGEGRVVGFKAASPAMESALTLRFTRLDARSKALVDRAAAVREAKGRALQGGSEMLEGAPVTVRKVQPSSPGFADFPGGEPPTHDGWDQQPAAAPSVPPPPPSSSKTVIARAPFSLGDAPRPPSSAPRLEEDPEDVAPQSAPPTSPELFTPPVSPPPAAAPLAPDGPSIKLPAHAALPGPERELLLDRLRSRARELRPEAVAAILARPAASSATAGKSSKRKRRGA